MPASKPSFDTAPILTAVEVFCDAALVLDAFTFEQLEEIGAAFNCGLAAILARGYGSLSNPERRMEHMMDGIHANILLLAKEHPEIIRSMETQGRPDARH